MLGLLPEIENIVKESDLVRGPSHGSVFGHVDFEVAMEWAPEA